MRDTKFFDEQLPFWDTKRKVSAWEHIKLAFEHQESQLGPHGGYIMGSTGDWSDFSTQFLQATESMLVTAQTAYAYPKLAELAELRGDTEFAKRLRASGERDVATLRREWTGKAWCSRGYSGDRQIGKGLLFEEPQPWALLAGVTVGREGYRIAPHLPFAHFSLRMPRIGVASEPGRLRGYVRPESDAPYALTVRAPASRVTTWVDGRVVPHTTDRANVRFDAHSAADWAVTLTRAVRACTSRRRFVIRLRGPYGERLRSARVNVAGRRVRVRHGLRAVVNLRGRPKQRTTVRIVGVTRGGRHVTALRRYRLCVARRHH